MTGDESWFRHYKTAEYGMAPFEFADKKESKDSAVTEIVMGTIFWVFLVEFLVLRETIDADQYVKTLYNLHHVLCDKHCEKKIVLQHDNTQPRSACLTTEKIKKMGWEVLLHTAYSPNMAYLWLPLFRVSETTNLRPMVQDSGGHIEASAQWTIFLGNWTGDYHKGIFMLSEPWEKYVRKLEHMLKSKKECVD